MAAVEEIPTPTVAEEEKHLTMKEAAAVGFFTGALSVLGTSLYSLAAKIPMHPWQYVVIGIVSFVAGFVGSLMSHALFKEGHKASKIVVSY